MASATASTGCSTGASVGTAGSPTSSFPVEEVLGLEKVVAFIEMPYFSGVKGD